MEESEMKDTLIKLTETLNRLIVVDGLDACGKGVAIKGLSNFFESLGLKVFDVDQYCKENGIFPEFENPNSSNYIDPELFDVFIVSEPTYCLGGRAIREEIISSNERDYSAYITAEAYSSDRAVLYHMVVLPLLKRGKVVIESRSITTSVCYQYVQAQEKNEDLSVEKILSLPGNKFVLSHFSGLLIIPVIKDVNVIEERLTGRDKKDNCIFETTPFQEKLNQVYKSDWFQEIFRKSGMKIEYIDASTSPEDTQREAVRVVREYFRL
jgi:thymidylate kinase